MARWGQGTCSPAPLPLLLHFTPHTTVLSVGTQNVSIYLHSSPLHNSPVPGSTAILLGPGLANIHKQRANPSCPPSCASLALPLLFFSPPAGPPPPCARQGAGRSCTGHVSGLGPSGLGLWAPLLSSQPRPVYYFLYPAHLTPRSFDQTTIRKRKLPPFSSPPPLICPLAHSPHLTSPYAPNHHHSQVCYHPHT